MAAQHIHVWHAALALDPVVRGTLDRLLASDERERAQRFVFERDRQRYVATRGLLRMILGGWLSLEPAALRFETNNHGKPHLIGLPDAHRVFFNVSHSGDHAVFAVTDRAEVGVDIEVVREVPDALEIADRFFSPAESDAIRRLPASQLASAFFRCWTRKEAYVKGVGSGLFHPLDTFEVTIDSDTPQIRSVSAAGPQLEDWSLHDLSQLPVYAAAVAIRAPDASVRLRTVNLDRLPTTGDVARP